LSIFDLFNIRAESLAGCSSLHGRKTHAAEQIDETRVGAEIVNAEVGLQKVRKYRAFYGVLLFTGIRTGEALGLTWEDIDFAIGRLR
jgi:integrase